MLSQVKRWLSLMSTYLNGIVILPKASSKAAAMCNMITKGKMPPKVFKKENPEFVLTQDERKIICDWSASIQIAKK